MFWNFPDGPVPPRCPCTQWTLPTLAITERKWYPSRNLPETFFVTKTHGKSHDVASELETALCLEWSAPPPTHKTKALPHPALRTKPVPSQCRKRPQPNSAGRLTKEGSRPLGGRTPEKFFCLILSSETRTPLFIPPFPLLSFIYLLLTATRKHLSQGLRMPSVKS